MAFWQPVVDCLLKKGLQRGESRAPQDPHIYALGTGSLEVIMRRIFRKKTLPRSLALHASFNSRNDSSQLISRLFIESLRLGHTEMTASSYRYLETTVPFALILDPLLFISSRIQRDLMEWVEVT